jgi:hypothetical protein
MDRELRNNISSADNKYVAELLATREAFQTLHTQPIHQLPQDITILSDWKSAIIFKACDGKSSAALSSLIGGSAGTYLKMSGCSLRHGELSLSATEKAGRVEHCQTIYEGHFWIACRIWLSL